MKKIIENFIEEIRKKLVQEMNDKQTCNYVTSLVLGAYNRYQEDEKDGANYLFDINNGNDLKCCIDGGMKAEEISWLYKECNKSAESTPYFMFGANHEKAETIETWDALKAYLTNFLSSIILYMITYQDVDGYKQLYGHCISDYIIKNIYD